MKIFLIRSLNYCLVSSATFKFHVFQLISELLFSHNIEIAAYAARILIFVGPSSHPSVYSEVRDKTSLN